jgi:hypothetical protein
VRSIPLHPAEVPATANGVPRNGKELSRLLTAAVINREFCNLLLANPALAVANGYNGQSFQLATEEEELILSIRATSLADFAAQLTTHGNSNGHSRRHNGQAHHHSGHNGTFNSKLNGHCK